MTFIVAAENMDDLSAAVIVTYDMAAAYIALDASRAGF